MDDSQAMALMTSSDTTTTGARTTEAQLWQRLARLCDRTLFLCYLLIFLVFFTTNIVTMWVNASQQLEPLS